MKFQKIIILALTLHLWIYILFNIMYKNIMLKISGESLAGSNEQGFDFDILNDLSNSIKNFNLKILKFLLF